MSFSYDSTGVQMKSGSDPVPDGRYTVKIIEAEEGTTKNGDFKVTVHYEIVEGPLKGRKINYHTVVFFSDKSSKGAGMSIHFLKCIRQPFEGEFIVSPSSWVGSLLIASIEQKKNSNKESKSFGQLFPSVRFIDPYTLDYTQAAPIAVADEDIPF